MSPPRVTVCIPSYNCAAFLAEAIESVLAQSFTDYELLILDDCSSDQSSRIAAQYAAQDARIITWVHQENLGMVQNWNTCLNAARGDYIKFLLCDDLHCSPEALHKMVQVLDRHPAVSLVASARNIIDEHSQVIKVLSSLPAHLELSGTEMMNLCLYTQKNLIGEPSVAMFRKSQGARGFNSRYNQLVDLEMWFHLLAQGSLAYLDEPLASFRVHGEQQTRKNVRNLVHVEEMLALLDEYGPQAQLSASTPAGRFLAYNQLYRIWKGYKSRLISREAALARISRRLPQGKFFLQIPLYKLLNPFWKFSCRARIRGLR
ncbi:glycosyltransferase family 2 protein [Citrifermentans bremense]|uniref:glycosyltransferase family 2 protein n=1 Tax=Citrifermentans bremense TaxID=60035 RepID=UPI000686B214|nr:glycosyltransferase [Citrifermentans bremense]